MLKQNSQVCVALHSFHNCAQTTCHRIVTTECSDTDIYNKHGFTRYSCTIPQLLIEDVCVSRVPMSTITHKGFNLIYK